MQLKDPIKQILIDTRVSWDHDETRQDVRDIFLKMIDCKTAALGWDLYASANQFKCVYHTCKARLCPSCGYRSILQWLREQWTQLPDVSYAGVVLTMPSELWSIFKQNRHLLRDLPTIGAEAIRLWMKDKYGIQPLILVVQHTFGRHLDFKPHLHILVSVGGVAEPMGRWINGLHLNHVAFMKLWRYAVISYLRRALRAGILKSELDQRTLMTTFTTQYERNWHSYLDKLVSKRQFLGYAARYIRRLPMAQRRIQEFDGQIVRFWTKDTKSGKIVLDELPKAEFIQRLADHTPDKHQNAIRYYGGLSPRSKSRTYALTFAFLRKQRRPRPRRLSWAESIIRYFGTNPLIDNLGEQMQFVGTYCPGHSQGPTLPMAFPAA